MDAAFVLP
jgi:hypothetical protein